jgi:hypothetical protein
MERFLIYPREPALKVFGNFFFSPKKEGPSEQTEEPFVMIIPLNLPILSS